MEARSVGVRPRSPRPAARRRRVIAAVTVLAAVLAGCSTGPDTAKTGGPATTGAYGTGANGTGANGTGGTTSVPAPGFLRARTPGERSTFTKPASVVERMKAIAGPESGVPVIEGDFADPFLLNDGRAFFVYSTNTLDQNLPVKMSVLGVSGRGLDDALPDIPAWSAKGFVWAPSVLKVDGGYVLYFSTRDAASNRQCIGVATSPNPAGPFTNHGTEPLVCQVALGGSIDPSPFTDPTGATWLLWKSDGNCCGLPTRLFSRRLTGDGLGFAGDPVELLRDSEPWEGGLIEAPSMVAAGDRFVLFYSANAWDTDRYAVGFALCASPAGPCVKAPGPWLASTPDALGPGGLETFHDRLGDTWVIYHAWANGKVGYDAGGARSLYVQRVDLDEQGPHLRA